MYRLPHRRSDDLGVCVVDLLLERTPQKLLSNRPNIREAGTLFICISINLPKKMAENDRVYQEILLKIDTRRYKEVPKETMSC